MIKRFSSLLKNTDVNRLIKNFFSLSVLKLINLILPFVTLPYLIKTLGLEKYGAIVLGLSLVAYFQSLTDYGFNLSATREIAKHRASREQLGFIYSKTQTSKLYLLLFSLSIIIPLIFIVPQFREDLPVYLLICLMLIGQSLFPEWFFRGIEQMGYITILDVIIKGGFTIGVFSLIKSPDDYWLYPFLFGSSYLFVAILSHILVIRKFKLKFYLVQPSKVIKNLKLGFPLFINQFMPNFYNNTTTFLIGMLLGKQAAGLFGAVRQITNLLNVLNSVVSTVVFPYLVRRQDKFGVFSKLYIIGFVAISALLILVHKPIFEWVGINNTDSSISFYILIVGIVFIATYSIYSTNYLISRGYDQIVMKITFGASIVGLLTSYPLISNFGIIGGAMNIAFAQFLMGGLAFLSFKVINHQSN
ncbi:oligosaccharide flippase family protein [Psychrobacter sp. AOP22-C1-22]|uniref:oligosaccharide flippase family protein n=1 Tax=unclassified Psychrobacter TaxID=196806 RepID=UPI001787D515|nr:oligosaccharide flippase family protein [Psychrobacter sp. FME6]MBE0407087.1 oligosaccharide flippase family protein [Psychrobacter sp. FME6]